jgi:hypothetical protein
MGFLQMEVFIIMKKESLPSLICDGMGFEILRENNVEIVALTSENPS